MEQLSGESPPQQQQQNDKWKRNCGGAALVALSDALKDSGGRGTLITTRRPNYGVGALRDREAVTKYGIGSSSEQKLFTPLQQLVQRNNDAVGMIKNICFKGKHFVYNVGKMDEEITAIELAERILKTIPNSKSKLIQIDYPNEYPKDEPMRRCPNIDKYYDEFNQKPSIGIDEGLYNFYQYAKKNWL